MATTSMPPCSPMRVLYGFQPVSETPSAGIRLPDVIVQASAIHLHSTTLIGVQMATVTAMVSLGCLVFSSLSTPSPFLSENTPIPPMSSQESLLVWTSNAVSLQTGIAASISQPSLSSSSARFRASSEATSMRRNLSPWLQYSLVNPITAGTPGCRQRHVDPAALIKQ